MCDDVIMMRQGVVVDRDSPQKLLKKYGRDTLEEVFIDVARNTEQVRSGRAVS